MSSRPIHSLLLLVVQWLLLRGSAPAADAPHLNPYRTFDDKTEQFGFSTVHEDLDNVLTPLQRRPFQPLVRRASIVTIREAFNSKYNLSSKLAGKILYFLTNGYSPERRPPVSLQPPFVVSPPRIDVPNLALYSSESLSVTLKLREGISKAEIVDIIPSSDQILTLFCSKSSLIKKPSCSQAVYDTDDRNISIVINYKIIPKKMGLSHFRLYLLCRINDAFLTVVTINGQYTVNRTLSFALHFYNPHFLIRYGRAYYNYLWLKNNGNSNALITDIIGFGNQLGLNYPPNFKKKHFAQQPIPTELKKRLEDSEPSYWNVPPKEERPVIEMFFLSIPNADFVKEAALAAGIANNRTKSTAPEPGPAPAGPPSDLARRTNATEAVRGRAGQQKVFVEPLWPNLEFNIFKLVIDSKMYYLNLLTYFNFDMRFWEHESINLGVFCSRGVRHEAAVFVSNRLDKAAVLSEVLVEQEDFDFQIEVASFYKHALILPFADEKFLLLKVIVHYKGGASFSALKANLIARLDIGQEKYSERLPIQAVFSERLFEVKDPESFVVDPTSRAFEVQLRQSAGSEVLVNRVEIYEGPRNDKLYSFDNLWERNSTTQKHAFIGGEFQSVANFKFNYTGEERLQNLRNHFVLVIYSLENIFTLGLSFSYKTPLCARGRDKRPLFRCDLNPSLNFGIFSSNAQRAKSRQLFLFNRTPAELFLRRMEILMNNPAFVLGVNITHFCNGSRIQATSAFRSNETQRENLSLLLLRGEHCRMVFTLQRLPCDTFKHSGVHLIFPVRFTLSDGASFLVNINFRFFDGKIVYRPHVVNVGLVFPGPVLSRSFKILSTFTEELAFEDTLITGPSKDMINIFQMDRSFEDRLNDLRIRFSIDPSHVFRQSSFYSQTNQTEEGLCLWDVERYNNTHTVWQKLLKDGLDRINATIHVVTNLKKNIRIHVRGRIVYPELVKLPLLLEHNVAGALNFHSVTIRNVFRKRMAVSLLLAPQSFLSMDSIDDEIIALIEKQAKPDGQNVICIEHAQISAESLRFFTRKLYLDSLQFINHPRPHLASGNTACFRFPDSAADREKFFLNFKSTTNFFFKFTQYNDKQDKSELLSKYLILIDDVRKYTESDEAIRKALASPPSEVTSLKDYFFKLLGLILGFRMSFRASAGTAEPKPSEPANVIYLNHVKAVRDYVSKKNVFVNPIYKGKSFTIPPLGSLTIKDALIVRSHADGSFSGGATNLLLKNNITAIYKVPLVLKRASPRLEHVSHDKAVKPSLGEPENSIYLSASTDSFRSRMSKLGRALLFYRRPIIKTIELKNTGSGPLRILRANLAGGRRRNGCLELFDLKPKTVPAGGSLKLRLLLLFCRKVNAFYVDRLQVHTKARVFDFRLVIRLEGFHVGHSEQRPIYRLLWNLQIAVYIVFLMQFLRYLWGKKRRAKLELVPKKLNAVFISEGALKEKLLVYNCRLNPAELNLAGRLSPLPGWLSLEKELQQIRLAHEPGSPPPAPEPNLPHPSARRAERRKPAHRRLREQIFSNINTNNPVENSYMSVEQLANLLDPDKSSSEDAKHDRRRKLISQAEFSREEIFNFQAENRFGSIGDRLGGKEEVSNSSFQTDHLNDISHSKTNRGNNQLSHLNPETLVYSFINKRQFEEEEEEEEEDNDVHESSRDFEHEVKEHEKLGQLFDIAPLTTARSRGNFNFLSQKLVTFKLDDNENEGGALAKRSRTKTDAKAFLRKNSEQSDSNFQPGAKDKGHADSLPAKPDFVTKKN